MFTSVLTLGYTLCTVELYWTDDGRECVAHFSTEAEARQCADGLRHRGGIQDLQLTDNDGEPLPYP